MLKIKEAIIVEGKYDKQKILSFADALVIETTGFDVFKNKETKRFISETAKKQGIVILTDSDRAGFRIRNHIKSFVPEQFIKNAYIPEIDGKERRKTSPSREGTLGVEGIDEEIIKEALIRSGCTIDGECVEKKEIITRNMLYEDGFFGREDSSLKRKALCETLNLPLKISVNSLLKALNSFCDIETYCKLKEIEENKRNRE